MLLNFAVTKNEGEGRGGERRRRGGGTVSDRNGGIYDISYVLARCLKSGRGNRRASNLF